MVPRPSDMLPYLTAKTAGVGGVLRARPEDFRVEEIPAYLPAGEGEHVYVTIEKTGLTTKRAAELLARALGADPRDVGWAGMKDRHAVTVQTLSFARVDPAAAERVEVEGVRVLSVGRHRNKLRVGHLHGNRFVLRLTGVTDPDALSRCLEVAEVLRASGAPNYYGEQRFGREGDNAARGRQWLKGEAKAPRDHFERKMLASAVQSELFNEVLARRVSEGLLTRYVDGDLAVRHPTGGPWAVDPAEAQGLYDAHAASPTGPMFGPSMKTPSGAVALAESEVLAASGLSLDDLARAGDNAQGARRALRVLVDDLTVEADGEGAVRFTFTLPAGGYATTVLREFRKADEDAGVDAG